MGTKSSAKFGKVPFGICDPNASDDGGVGVGGGGGGHARQDFWFQDLSSFR